MTAAQFYAAACSECPQIPLELEQGQFDSLRRWLGRNVHDHASSQSTSEIVEKATGRPFDVGSFKRHLTQRYLED
jgi:carboxypeptidase Taq